jgi:prepilin-type N-terminal cleavage/methylation domain-containing protein
VISRLRAPRRAQDAGMTLVETLVAISITSILLAGVATVFSGTLRGVNAVNVTTATTGTARIAMEAMTRTIRVAILPATPTNQSPAVLSALSSATTNGLAFYALINRTGSDTNIPTPTFVQYSWDGTCINEAQIPQRTKPDGTYAWDTGGSTKCLARTSIAPVFSYYTNGTSITPLTVPPLGLSASSLQTVKSIGLTVTIRDPRNPSVGAVPVTDRVTLVNVQS